MEQMNGERFDTATMIWPFSLHLSLSNTLFNVSESKESMILNRSQTDLLFVEMTFHIIKKWKESEETESTETFFFNF